jgi:anaerobic selenocysteine-containing dehydrogenase
MKKAVRKGATLVVADPRRIWLTKIAKRHLQLRPGSDVWLLNAMMHVILEEGLQDEGYIREHTEDFDSVREVVARYSPEEAEQVTGVPAEAIRATAREYATERHAGIFYTLGITEHACAIDNIWSLSNLVLMTGHLGYESTGLNALRGQNNVQGLNDAGANPAYLPGYQPANDPEIRRKFALGRRGAGDARLPARPDDLRPPRRADPGLLPDRGEPGAHGAERAPRRERLRAARLPRLAGHLPLGDGAQARGRGAARLELCGEGRNVHEHRAAREPGAGGGAVPRQLP